MAPHVRAATILSMVLDPAEARNYWRALLDNATQLIADATLLYNADSHGRARALTVLAEEELGKATSVYDLFSYSWSAQETEPLELEQRSSRDHLAKYIAAFEFGRELDMFWGGGYPDIPEDDDWERWHEEQKAEAATAARAANLQKQRGFYVDMANGEMTTPRDFDVEDVAEHLERAAGVIEMMLIKDHTRMQDEPPEQYDSTHALQWRVMPAAHGLDYQMFIESMRETIEQDARADGSGPNRDGTGAATASTDGV